MAVAGRVAIRPRGSYDATVSYERLDMVKYQNTLFVAKKAVSGVTPVDGEHWMDCGGTDLSDIEKKITALENPEFTEAEELAALTSKEYHTTLWGKVAKAVSSLIAHIGNKENPHKVTASQVGALTAANIANSTVVTESGFAADARQLNSEVEGSYAKEVAEQIYGINDSLLNGIQTISFFGEVSANPEYYTIYAHGVSKLNVATKTMDLHFSIIPQKVSGVTIPSDTWNFMSKAKISELLGISDFTFSFNNSFAIPSVDFGYTDIATGAGKSGFIIGENSMALGRIYTESGNAGTWGVNSSLYEKLSGKQISIDIYGATYS